MKKQEAYNTFSDGMLLDLNPLQMPNDALSNCLNGTLLTFNGDENVLLNDMGNARVETAMLPAGYVPLGTTSFGGIIYIVSFNPQTKEYQIGSFPSPERNLSKDELGDDSKSYINIDAFCQGEFGSLTSIVTSYYLKVNLTNFNVHAGDKFKVFSNDINSSIISAWDPRNTDCNPNNYPKYVRLDVVSTLEDGKSVSLTDDLTWNSSFYIYKGNVSINANGELSLPEYRNSISANYDVYLNKIAGKLGVTATLEIPTSFSVGYDVLTLEKANNIIDINFYFYLNWSNNLIGDFKSLNNPAGIEINFEEKGSSAYPIKLRTTSNSVASPDNRLDTKYYTIVPPDDYTNDDWNVKNYLLNGNNNFGKELRKNDGSDFLYLMVGPRIEYNKANKKWSFCNSTTCYSIPDGVIDVNLTPIMPFGKLKFLQKTLSINLDNLQSDKLDFNSYQYYVSDNDVNMNFNIEYYPSLGNSIKKVDIELYEFIANASTTNWKLQATYDNECLTDLTPTGECFKKVTINGNANGFLKITFNRDNLNKDRIYIVKFIIDCSGTNRVFYRLFFNSTIFNAEYSFDCDFKDLKLYSPNLKGGIKPKFYINDSSKNIDYVNMLVKDGVEIPNEDNLPQYKIESGVEKISHFYEITNEVIGHYAIDSGLGEELGIMPSNIVLNSASVEYDSDCNLLNVSSQPNTLTINNLNRINLSNTFIMEVPYTIDYSDSEQLDVYIYKPLSKNSNKIRMSHWSVNKEEGYFSLWANKEWQSNDYRALFVCPRDSIDLSYSFSDDFESKLLQMLESTKSDYIVAVFGIEGFGDTNIGYAYNVTLGTTGYSLYFKLNNQNNHYHVVNVIRKSDGSAMIIHGRDLLFNDNLHDAIVKDFDSILARYDTKDLQVIKDTYRKYAKNGESKTIFYVKDISNDDKTLSVTATYKANVNITVGGILLIDNTNINGTNVTNFKMDDIENIDVSLPITTTIDNSKVIERALFKDSTTTGWYNGKLINQDDLSKVYEANRPVLNMSIRESDGVLIYDESKLDKVKWYFGWEDIGGDTGGKIDQDKFNLCKQRYDVKYTYRVK